MSKTDTEIAQLHAENAALKALLAMHGIAAPPAIGIAAPVIQFDSSQLSPEAKVKLFRRLFRGREDIYPVRWISKTTERPGYSPVCANELRRGVCEKPRIKCCECSHNLFVPVTNYVVFRHLRGEITAGVYPLLLDNRCYFLATDFDDADWREDARAVLKTCVEK